MTITQLPAPGRLRRPGDLPRLDSVVPPRWLRERRRRAGADVERLAAVLDRLGRPAAADRRPRTIDEILDAQGVRPFDADRWRQQSELTGEDWAELRAALRLVRGA